MPESDPEDFLTPALASEPGLLPPDRDLDLDYSKIIEVKFQMKYMI